MRTKTELQYKKDILEVCKRIYSKGYVAANDGNVSIKLPDGNFLTTHTGRSKGFLTLDEIVKVSPDGKPISKGKPSTEVEMHLGIYKERPDVNAIVHAHPVFATSFALARIPLDQCTIPEIVTTLGAVPLADYSTPSTQEVSDSLKEPIGKADAVLLANHGVVCAGFDVFDAYFKLERVEHFAQITFYSKMLGGEKLLTCGEVGKLRDIQGKYGVIGKTNECIPAQNPTKSHSQALKKAINELC
ncbi:MAG: class II aldolase/adducin family protein [Calditrichaeota bacterium]|nr:MAG: class II aldolase/adducin family protein [Calditrichota bacterium]